MLTLGMEFRRHGGIGRHKGLKIPRSKIRTGSIPVAGTNKNETPMGSRFYFAPQPRIERSQVQMSGGHLLPPVQTLVATLIFCKAENANRFRLHLLFIGR